MLRVVQDANRAASVAKFRTSAQTIAYIRGRITTLALRATITSVVTAGVISSTVPIPSEDLTATGLLSIMVVVNSQQMLEA